MPIRGASDSSWKFGTHPRVGIELNILNGSNCVCTVLRRTWFSNSDMMRLTGPVMPHSHFMMEVEPSGLETGLAYQP